MKFGLRDLHTKSFSQNGGAPADVASGVSVLPLFAQKR